MTDADLENIKEAFVGIIKDEPILSASHEAIKDLFESNLDGGWQPTTKEEIEGMVEGQSRFEAALEAEKPFDQHFTKEVKEHKAQDTDEAKANFLKNLQ